MPRSPRSSATRCCRQRHQAVQPRLRLVSGADPGTSIPPAEADHRTVLQGGDHERSARRTGRRGPHGAEGTVVYGCSCRSRASRRSTSPSGETKSGPDELARAALAAEAAGFFYSGLRPHGHPERLAQAMGTVWYDTVATLGWLAGVTSDVRLLSHVLVLANAIRCAPRRSSPPSTHSRRPAHRGVGAGHVPRSTRCSGIRGRGRDTDEAVNALAAALSESSDAPGLAGRLRHGGGPASGAPAAPSDLDRRVLEGGDPPNRGTRRRVVAAGYAPQGSAGPDRRPSPPARRAPGRSASRHRHHRRAHLPRGWRLGRGPRVEQPGYVLQGTPEQVAQSHAPHPRFGAHECGRKLHEGRGGLVGALLERPRGLNGATRPMSPELIEGSENLGVLRASAKARAVVCYARFFTPLFAPSRSHSVARIGTVPRLRSGMTEDSRNACSLYVVRLLCRSKLARNERGSARRFASVFSAASIISAFSRTFSRAWDRSVRPRSARRVVGDVERNDRAAALRNERPRALDVSRSPSSSL